ncbi:MAG: hypothetical protein A4E66_02661 [Syntrophus sp. PtaB.Bin001]|nr:MAG: hypothetical protein A4E66_02661 [Syntrophus sp. PtaB.Bin001]
MDSRRVHKDELGVFRVEYPRDPVPGGLGFVGDDGQFLAQNAVEQCRFSHIGPADDSDKAGFEHD